jgi:hypothetical protein
MYRDPKNGWLGLAGVYARLPSKYTPTVTGAAIRIEGIRRATASVSSTLFIIQLPFVMQP